MKELILDIAYDNVFKSCEHKAKLLWNIAANWANETYRNFTNTVLLKYVSKFLRSLKILLINWKVELKLK